MSAPRETGSIFERVHVLRSKNAGPYVLTLDLVLDRRADFDKVLAGLDAEGVANAYRIAPDNVLSITSLESLNAIKICISRRVPAGHPGDPDCYGMNQEEPLAALLRAIPA